MIEASSLYTTPPPPTPTHPHLFSPMAQEIYPKVTDLLTRGSIMNSLFSSSYITKTVRAFNRADVLQQQ